MGAERLPMRRVAVFEVDHPVTSAAFFLDVITLGRAKAWPPSPTETASVSAESSSR